MVSNSIVKNTLIFLVYIFLIHVNSYSQTPFHTSNIIVGAQQLNSYRDLLDHKSVGILTNQTGVVTNQNGQQENTVDFLLRNGVRLKKIYAPEHGFRGTADAGELIKDGKDFKTGLPIISLYGNSKKPSREQLQGIDIMLFDLQDVGARFYTYISSLHYLMEACAEYNIPIIILDRPNPNIAIIDGPVLEPEYKSFVGMHPIPTMHGMTIGEYAQMINGEKWLDNGIQAKLTVIPVENYTRNKHYILPVPPSPNLPNEQAINLYPSLCFFEGTNVSSGRGTDLQFQVYGSPYLQNMPYKFTPRPNNGAKDPMNNGKLCYGEDLSSIDFVDKLEIKWLLKAYNNSKNKDKFFNNFFNKLAGNKKLKEQIQANWSETAIRATWKEGLDDFKLLRTPYLIYSNDQHSAKEKKHVKASPERTIG